HRPLGTGGVVLRQPSDLLEERAARGVVEPPRWQPLRRRGQPGSHVLAQRPGQVVLVEVDLQLGYGHEVPQSVISTPSGVATTCLPSSTCGQPASSPSGSELPSRRPPSRRTDNEWPAVLATTCEPSVSSRFSRDPGAALSTSATVCATASAGLAPARSR